MAFSPGGYIKKLGRQKSSKWPRLKMGDMPQSPRIRSKVNWVQIIVYTSDFGVFIN